MGVERAQVVVIGGGVVGCAILFELARRGVAGLLVEAEPDVCEGTSKANSAIVHTGFDAKPGTVEARMLRRAAELWPLTVDELGVPFLAVGALMLARTAAEAGRLAREIAPNAAALGVRTELLDGGAARASAPWLAGDVTAALSVPDEAVIDPFWLTRALAEAALAGGAEALLGRAVAGLTVYEDGVDVRLDDGTAIRADQVVDAAGVRADDVAQFAGDRSFAIRPRKGEFLVSEETFGVDRIVLPIPGPMGKGMLVTPIVFGGLLLGPTATDVVDKDDRAVDPAEGARIRASCAALVPALADAVPVRQFAGVRHVSSTGDFIVRPSDVGDRLYLVAGIRSTGVSTSIAIAEAVADDLLARRGWRAAGGRRRLDPPPTELPEAPGELVCLCRSISRGEIEAACRRPVVPATLDAAKRRGGATFGDCQGNLCALDVARILARERAGDLASVEKHRRGSWLWEAAPGLARPSRPRGRAMDVPDVRWDVVVIGGGAAGRSATHAALSAGCSTVVVERDQRRTQSEQLPLLDGTAVGLSPSDGGWLVLVQGREAGREVTARTVLVATGAYVQPREHRPIAGPRPAGIYTADLVERLLEAGMRPGRRVALVGTSRRADALAAALADAGARVQRVADAPDAVRGERRLEAARFDGTWLEADTLVLADRLVPQAFLLRGLGLLDGRPGTPLPVDGDGRLPLEGLWAAGCCVAPSMDHEACAESGRRVATALASSLAIRNRVPT